MSASVLALAKKYYPKLWDDARIDALVAAGRLTAEEDAGLRKAVKDGVISAEEYREITGETLD